LAQPFSSNFLLLLVLCRRRRCRHLKIQQILLLLEQICISQC